MIHGYANDMNIYSLRNRKTHVQGMGSIAADKKKGACKMHNLTLQMSRGAGAKDNTITDFPLTWQKFIAVTKDPISTGHLTIKQALEAQKQVRAADKDGLWIIPAVFGPPKRAASNVRETCAFICDFDSGIVTGANIVENLDGLEYVAYTSYSHAPGVPYTDPTTGGPAEGKEKWRVVIPYITPMTKNVGLDPEEGSQLLADQHRAVYTFFNTLFDGQLDPRCETISQLWYLPRCPSDGVALYRQIVGGGDLFNPEVAFRAAAAVAAAPPPTQPVMVSVGQLHAKTQGGTVAMQEAEHMLAVLDLSMRDTWLKTAMAMKAEFGDDGFEVWHARAVQCAGYVDEADCRKNWDSLKKNGKTTFGTLRWMAQQAGWKPMAPVAHTSEPADPSADELASALAYLSPESEEARTQVAAWLKAGRGDEGRSVWLKWAQTGAGFNPETDKAVWDMRVVFTGDLGPLYDAAKLRGWTPPPPTVPSEIAELNARYFVAKHGRKTYVWTKVLNQVTDQEEFVPTDKQSFLLDLANRKMRRVKKSGEESFVPLATHWLEHPQRRQYAGGVVFAPEGARPDQYNQWEGFSVEPMPGDWSLLKRHIFEVVCSGKPEHYKYLIRWMAWAVQNPGKVPEVAVVMKGDERTGKGTVAKVMTDLFGKHAFTSAQSSQLTGKFNGHLANIALLYMDEALWGGDKASEGVLKQMITEPTLPVEYKGVDVSLTKNHLKVIITSNNDWVVPMSEGAADGRLGFLRRLRCL
jgi:hypothetical protein